MSFMSYLTKVRNINISLRLLCSMISYYRCFVSLRAPKMQYLKPENLNGILLSDKLTLLVKLSGICIILGLFFEIKYYRKIAGCLFSASFNNISHSRPQKYRNRYVLDT